MGQPPPPQQQQVPSPARSSPAGDGRLPEGDTAALAAQLAAGGDSAMRLQQILANLPMVSTLGGPAHPAASVGPMLCLGSARATRCPACFGLPGAKHQVYTILAFQPEAENCYDYP